MNSQNSQTSPKHGFIKNSPGQDFIRKTLELATFDVSFVCVSLALPGKLVILNSSLVSRMIKIFMGN
jgi:hypothetical protein